MSSKNLGLAFCGADFGSSFCICKLLEVILSSVILIVVVHDMIVRYQIQRQLNFFILICVLIILALISNIIYSMDHQIHVFNDFQGYLFDAYFGLIVYYVARRLYMFSKPVRFKRTVFWTIHITFMVYNGLLLAILIKNLVLYVRCEDIEQWYIIADILGLLASVVLVIMGIIHTKNQQEKIKGLKNPQHYKNPIFSIWIWISINIFSQICSFVESLVFTFNPQLDCAFTESYNLDVIIKFIFAILSFHLGMIATVVFFRQKYEQAQRASTPEKLRKQSANLELIEMFEVNKDTSIAQNPDTSITPPNHDLRTVENQKQDQEQSRQ